MRIHQALSALAIILSLALVGCSDSSIVDGLADQRVEETVAKTSQKYACWGQASAVYAKMGLMGEHSSQQEEPRIGLANLARYLFELGIIAEPTMQALGAFFATELGLSIEACGT